MTELSSIVEKQKKFALQGMAKNLDFRKRELERLKSVLLTNEEAIYAAIYKDFRKSKTEAFMTELSVIYHEIDLALRKLPKWSRTKRVRTGLINFPGRSYIQPEPLGSCLIIGPWNYPYQLILVPLVSAIAAGNTAILKPSELTANTSAMLAKLINENFDPRFIFVAEGGVETSGFLLKAKFDKIFFTGSTEIGKIVARAAAETLTPVTLELGGKSPCFVFADCDLKRTAQRIAWGKFLNAGQTCVAPDYVLVESQIYDAFLTELKSQTHKLYGPDPKESESYARIVNRNHLQRLRQLIEQKNVVFGGRISEEENYIEPTVLRDVSFSDRIMKDEIFGPLLPVLPFDDLEEAIKQVKSGSRPLALYIFAKKRSVQKRILQEISFGGGAVNDVVMHLANPRLPFGGVGESGMGSYHGEAGFRSFSHFKSFIEKSFWFEAPFKYPPYTNFKIRILSWILK